MPVSSTFTTSAPKSASSSEQKPPGKRRERSSTRMPSSGRRHVALSSRCGIASIARASRTVAGRRPMSSVICRAFAISSPLELRHLAVRQVQVVLEADADRAAERERRRHQHPLVARDPDHAPVRARGDVVDHRREVARRRRDAADHAHHAVDVQRRLQHAHVDQRREAADVADVEALVLRFDAELVHRLQQLDDLCERVLEDHVEHELLARARVLGVVHRAHVQRRHLRAARAQVFDALLRPARRSCPSSS